MGLLDIALQRYDGIVLRVGFGRWSRFALVFIIIILIRHWHDWNTCHSRRSRRFYSLRYRCSDTHATIFILHFWTTYVYPRDQIPAANTFPRPLTPPNRDQTSHSESLCTPSPLGFLRSDTQQSQNGCGRTFSNRGWRWLAVAWLLWATLITVGVRKWAIGVLCVRIGDWRRNYDYGLRSTIAGASSESTCVLCMFVIFGFIGWWLPR